MMGASSGRPIVAPPPGARGAESAGSHRRADIDGLRTVAIALVVIYHVWLGRVSGGVDVFLLLSAYLVTESFLRRWETGAPPRLIPYWWRRFARLLPAAAAVIVIVLAVRFVAQPPSTWPELWAQSWASAFYVQNWELAFNSVDYYARTETIPSPLQHFWSLSMQGQIFLLWPCLLALSGYGSRRLGWSPRRAAGVVFSIVFLGSLTYSIITTAARQEFAYFDTLARLWEFALGSLLVIVLPYIRIGRIPALVLGWGGLVGLVSCGLVMDVGTGFPGYAALWPTLSAVAVLLAGHSTRPSAATRLLGSPVLSRLGPITYALYLVHWPILIAFLGATGQTRVGLREGALVIGVSVLAAFLLHRLVEVPVQRWGGGKWGPRGVAVIALLMVVVPLVSWQGAERIRFALAETISNPGAAVLMPWQNVVAQTQASLVPLGSALDTEWTTLEGPCTGERRPAQALAAERCSERVSGTADAPTILVIGDSHAQQWMATLTPTVIEQDWTMIAVLAGGCSLGLGEMEKTDTECRAWRDATISYAESSEADLVVMIGTKAVPEEASERVPRGLDDVVEIIVNSGSDVLLVRDNPRFDADLFQCVERLGPEAPDCSRSAADVMAPTNPAEVLVRDGVTTVDLTDYLCPEGLCRSVIGDVIVYLDHNHLTRSYAESMAPAMQRELTRIGRLWGE